MTMNQQLIEQTEQETQALSISEQARTRGTIEAALTVAAARPRNEQQAIARLMTSCQRVRLAESAVYTYSKGGTDITGPSITLVVQVALAWGNLDWGYRELSRGRGESTVEAYAWDQQSNAKYTRQFVVPHRIRVGGRQRQLREDELADWIANQAQRRVRTCLENVIPRDVIDEAVDECGRTLRSNIELDQSKILAMVSNFAEMGVSQEQLAAKIQRSVDAIQPAQYLAMRRIYVSIRDGLQTAEQAFPAVQSDSVDVAEATSNKTDAGSMLAASKKSQDKPPMPKRVKKKPAKKPKPKQEASSEAKEQELEPEPEPKLSPEEAVIDGFRKEIRAASNVGELNVLADQVAYDATMGAIPKPQADSLLNAVTEKLQHIEEQK